MRGEQQAQVPGQLSFELSLSAYSLFASLFSPNRLLTGSNGGKSPVTSASAMKAPASMEAASVEAAAEARLSAQGITPGHPAMIKAAES
jgi:hypothetical protein